MGIGILIWSWLSFALPLQQQSLFAAVEKAEQARLEKSGIASFYHEKFVGRRTATGEVFSNEKFTAASNHFKLGTFVKVTNVKNGRSIYVKINDRMGHPGRIIDLTEKAAGALKFIQKGLARVVIEPVPASEGKQRILAQSAPTGTPVADPHQLGNTAM